MTGTGANPALAASAAAAASAKPLCPLAAQNTSPSPSALRPTVPSAGFASPPLLHLFPAPVFDRSQSYGEAMDDPQYRRRLSAAVADVLQQVAHLDLTSEDSTRENDHDDWQVRLPWQKEEGREEPQGVPPPPPALTTAASSWWRTPPPLQPVQHHRRSSSLSVNSAAALSAAATAAAHSLPKTPAEGEGGGAGEGSSGPQHQSPPPSHRHPQNQHHHYQQQHPHKRELSLSGSSSSLLQLQWQSSQCPQGPCGGNASSHRGTGTPASHCPPPHSKKSRSGSFLLVQTAPHLPLSPELIDLPTPCCDDNPARAISDLDPPEEEDNDDAAPCAAAPASAAAAHHHPALCRPLQLPPPLFSPLWLGAHHHQLSAVVVPVAPRLPDSGPGADPVHLPPPRVVLPPRREDDGLAPRPDDTDGGPLPPTSSAATSLLWTTSGQHFPTAHASCSSSPAPAPARQGPLPPPMPLMTSPSPPSRRQVLRMRRADAAHLALCDNRP